jgi:hypothetical protein
MVGWGRTRPRRTGTAGRESCAENIVIEMPHLFQEKWSRLEFVVAV